MKKIITIILIIKGSLVMSQNNYFPAAPEASTLIKTVDVPINNSTGGVSYSIPIHNITLKDLIIPISLSYQSSGFKPTEIASNVGFGWDLNVGGKITQNVIEKNDFHATRYSNLPNDRDFKLPLPSNSLYLVNNYNLDSLHNADTDLFIFDDINTYGKDTHPDIFYYSTPVNSGKFFFASNFETKQIPFGKEKIVYNPLNQSFEIVDTKGIKYLYEIRTENINTTINQCSVIPELNGVSNNNSYTYYLSKIVTPSNEIVDFIYETVKYNLINDTDYTRYYQSFYGGTEKTTSYYSNITTKVLAKIIVNNKVEVEFIYSKYRKDIKGFQQQFAPKTLDGVKIIYNNDINVFQFDYGYFGINDSPYNSNVFESITNNEDSNYRLKLKSFQKNGENPYLFTYNNESAIQRYTQCLDHWGFYNESCSRYTFNSLFGDSYGASKEPNLLQTQSNILKSITLPTMGSIDFTYELNDCFDCNISYPNYYWDNVVTVYSNTDDVFTNDTQIIEEYFTMPENFISCPFIQFNINSNSVLTTENYASVRIYDDQNLLINFELTGIGNQNKPFVSNQHLESGKTYKVVLESKDTIENENKFFSINVLYSYYNPITIDKVGGVRIKNTQIKEQNEIKYNKSYEYKISNHSSGKLYEIPSYFDEYSRPFINGTDDLLAFSLSGYLAQHSRMPGDLFGFDGHHIYYEKVTEKKHDIQNISNSIITEKYFTFYDDLRYGDDTFMSKISYNWKRGLISQINELKNSNILRKTSFSYKFLDTAAETTNISSYEPNSHIDNPTFPNEFHIRNLDINLERINVNFYNLYSYKSSKLISAWYYMDKKKIEENFNGNILITEETYKYDNPLSTQLTSQISTTSNGDSIETKYTYAHDANMTDMLAKNMISIPLKTETFRNGAKLATQETVYKNWGNNLLAPQIIRTAKGNQPLEDKVKYNVMDNTNGNPLEVEQIGGVKVSYIYGYNQTLPVAKLENMAYSSIPANLITAIQSATNTGTEASVISALNSLRTNAAVANAMITTFTYKPLIGVSTITDPKGDTITYEYDSFGRLSTVKDKNGNILSENQYHYRTQN